jgi:hypothetical protein
MNLFRQMLPDFFSPTGNSSAPSAPPEPVLATPAPEGATRVNPAAQRGNVP